MPHQSLRQEILPAPLFDDKPFALSIGPQRTGTSWLDRYLRARGDVCLPTDVKETFFFDQRYKRGRDFYKDRFKPAPDHQLVMEISTTAFDHPEAPSRVYNICGPVLTLICPLRHPVMRSYSLYRHLRRYGLVNGNLRSAVSAFPQILETSRYAAHLARWGDRFGLESISLVFHEDLENNHEAFLRRICRILNLDYLAPDEHTAPPLNVSTRPRPPFVAAAAQNAAQWARDRELYGLINLGKQLGLKRLLLGRDGPENLKESIPAADLEWLSSHLHPEIQNLETLLGHPLPQWRTRTGTDEAM